MTPVNVKRTRSLCRVAALASILVLMPVLAVAAPAPTATLKNPAPDHRPAAPATATYHLPGPVDVLVNGNAEADVGAASSVQFVCPSHWTCTHDFTIVKYGVEDFPASGTPGPTDRGANLFAGGGGGPGPVSTATQTISLTSLASRISSGQEGFTLGGWLGGWNDQSDHADVSVVFKDANNNTIGSPTSLASVTPGDRHNLTALVARSATGVVPAGATSAVVTITMTEQNGGYNDGYADDLSLVLN